MAKVLNAVFGIGIAVVLYIVVLLGIQAFYPTVEYGDYCNESFYAKPIIDIYSCDENITVKECRELMYYEDYSEEYNKCYKAFDEANEKYNKNFFIIATLIGTLIIISAYFLLHLTNISAGVACSGIVLVLWGFMRGWQNTDNMVKFVISLIIAVVVIFLALKVNKRLNK